MRPESPNKKHFRGAMSSQPLWAAFCMPQRNVRLSSPNGVPGQFARLCSSADCAQKSSAEPAVSGASLTVAGNIDIEGLTTKAAMELPEQPCLRSAAPVKSLLEGGALLSAVAHAGEFLGLLSPDAPGRSIMAGIRSTRSMGNGALGVQPQLRPTSWLPAPLPAHSS